MYKIKCKLKNRKVSDFEFAYSKGIENRGGISPPVFSK
jgi:hypothetical protein